MDEQSLLLKIKAKNKGVDDFYVIADNICTVIYDAIQSIYISFRLVENEYGYWIEIVDYGCHLDYMQLKINIEQFFLNKNDSDAQRDRTCLGLISTTKLIHTVLSIAGEINESKTPMPIYTTKSDKDELELEEIGAHIIECIKAHTDDAWIETPSFMTFIIGREKKIKMTPRRVAINWEDRIVQFAVEVYRVFENPLPDAKVANTQ